AAMQGRLQVIRDDDFRRKLDRRQERIAPCEGDLFDNRLFPSPERNAPSRAMCGQCQGRAPSAAADHCDPLKCRRSYVVVTEPRGCSVDFHGSPPLYVSDSLAAGYYLN